MKNFKYKVKFKTDFSKGEAEGDCQAKDGDTATDFLMNELSRDLMIDKSEITSISLTEIPPK